MRANEGKSEALAWRDKVELRKSMERVKIRLLATAPLLLLAILFITIPVLKGGSFYGNLVEGVVASVVYVGLATLFVCFVGVIPFPTGLEGKTDEEIVEMHKEMNA